jgi:hypothetical protein
MCVCVCIYIYIYIYIHTPTRICVHGAYMRGSSVEGSQFRHDSCDLEHFPRTFAVTRCYNGRVDLNSMHVCMYVCKFIRECGECLRRARVRVRVLVLV